MRNKCVYIMLLLCLIFSFSSTFAQEITAITTVNLNVRSLPAANGTKLGQLPINTTVIVEARSEDSQWILGRSQDGSLRGWMSVDYLVLSIDVQSLPASTETFSAPPAAVAPPPAPAATGSALLSSSVIRANRTVFERGQRLGNNPNMLIKIGDSNSNGNEFNPSGYAFLCAYTHNAFDLGAYGYLGGAVNFFGPGLCQPTPAAQNGFSTASVLDSTWSASIPGCTADETPLACAVRIYRPSVAIIYFGLGDMAYFPTSQSRQNYNAIISYLKEQGVIPVLTTFTLSDDHVFASQVAAYNQVIRRAASSNSVPLIEFQAAAYNLPNRGTIPNDGYHLLPNPAGVVAFNGEENTYGSTLRHLLTLQMLYAIQTQIMGY